MNNWEGEGRVYLQGEQLGGEQLGGSIHRVNNWEGEQLGGRGEGVFTGFGRKRGGNIFTR